MISIRAWTGFISVFHPWSTPGLPAISLEKNGTHGWLSVEFLQRKDGGLIYQPQTTTNLVTYEVHDWNHHRRSARGRK